MKEDILGVIRLYQSRENNNKTTLTIAKRNNDNLISISYNEDYLNATEITAPLEFDNQTIYEVLKEFKKENTITDEKINFISKDNCDYMVTLSNNERVIIKNYSYDMINNIKVTLTGKSYVTSEIKPSKQKTLGFSNYLLLLIVVIILITLSLVAIVIFK